MIDMNTQIAALLTSTNTSSTEATVQQKAVSPLLTSLLQNRVSVSQEGNTVRILLPSQSVESQPLLLQTPAPVLLSESTVFAIAKTGSTATLFDFLSLNQTTTMNQANVQRLIRTLADAITLGSLQSTNLSKGLNLHGMIESSSPQKLNISLQLPGSPSVTLPMPRNTTLFSTGEKVRIHIQAPDIQRDQQQWPVSVSRIPSSNTSQTTVTANSPLIKLALVKGLGTEGIKIEGVPSKSTADVLLSPAPRQPAIISATLTLKHAQFTLQGVQSNPVLQFPAVQLPAGTADSTTFLLPEHFLSTLNRVPQARQSPLQTPSPVASPNNAAPQSSFSSENGEQTLQVTRSSTPSTSTAKQVQEGKILPVSQLDESHTPKIQEKIRQLSRQLLAETGSTNEALGKLVQILRTHTSHAPQTADISKQWLEKISLTFSTDAKMAPLQPRATSSSTTYRYASESPPEPSASAIKQLLTAQPLVTTPSSILTPPAGSDFLSALVSILQLGLTGRALRNQSGLSAIIDKPDSVIAKSIGNASPGHTPSKIASDMAALDQRTQLLKHVKTLLANHQQQKIQSAESRTLGNDSFYYVLPVTRDENKAPELLFRAEEKEASDNKKSVKKGRIWHLTMKLDVGELGELLAKSRIEGDKLKLDVYASTDPLLCKVYDTLPYLLRRLSHLGIEVDGHSCQRGQLKGLLKDAPYQLFEALV